MATWLSRSSNQHRTIRRNVFGWCGVYLLIFFLLTIRLFWLQVVRHNHYLQEAERYRDREIILPAKRGRLLDRNLAMLAVDDQRPSLFIDPTLVQHPEFVAQQLSPVIARPAEEILATIKHELPFVWVKRHLSPEMYAAVASLNRPELQLKPDGSRYRLGVDLHQVTQVDALVTQLAHLLPLPEKEIRAQLGITTTLNHFAVTPATAAIAAAPPAGLRWVRGIYDEDTRHTLQALKLPGLVFQVDGPSYSLGIDPRLLTQQPAYPTARELAARLAPVLQMTPASLEEHLQPRPRFAWLKRNLSPEMGQIIEQMQGTLYVVTPGCVPDLPESNKNEIEVLSHAVERLYKILNEKGAPEHISREEIRRRLLPGAAPGALGVKLLDGQPSLLVSRSLLANPIPGSSMACRVWICAMNGDVPTHSIPWPPPRWDLLPMKGTR